MEVHVGEEGGVGKVSESRGIIGHGVERAMQEGHLVTVTVETLVFGGELAKVCRCAIGGGGPTVGTRKCRGVIRHVGDGYLPDIVFLGHDIELSDTTGLLEVAVRDVPFRVLEGDEAVPYPIGVGRSPRHGATVVGEVDSPHGEAAGIMRADQSGLVRDNLGEASRTGGEILDQSLEGGQVRTNRWVHADPTFVGLGQSQLQNAEEALATRDAYGGKSELAEQAHPYLLADALLSLQGFEEGK